MFKTVYELAVPHSRTSFLESDRNSLLSAAKTGIKDKVKSVLDKYPNIDRTAEKDTFNKARIGAIDSGSVSTTSLLLAKNEVNTDIQGMSPLSRAARKGNSKMTRFLLGRGARTKPETLTGQDQAIHWATQSGSKSTTSLLLKNGAYADARGLNDRTPMHYAAEKGDINIAETLTRHGADPTLTEKSPDGDFPGKTPLHTAVKRPNNEAFVEYLLKQNASVNAAAGKEKLTPLHIASSLTLRDIETNYGRKPVIDALVDKGADLEAKDSWGRTPVVIAKDSGEPRIVEWLKAHGAKDKPKSESKGDWSGCTRLTHGP
jgi:ankyrin repeat protein